MIEDSRTADGDSAIKMDNPMNDNSAPPLDEESDPFGIISKHDKGFKDILDVNPQIDPMEAGLIQDNSRYTNTPLAAIAFSNGGTSTGSWNSPYGFGSYNGPSTDSIAFSHGGSSTGTVDPFF